MIEIDEDALICDLAETYQIFDYRSLPVKLVATLSAGLRDNSRIKLKMVDSPVSLESAMLAVIADNLTLLRAGFGKENRAKPFLFTDAINGGNKKQKVKGFKTAEQFEAALSKIRGE
jgi:hypothetical protein